MRPRGCNDLTVDVDMLIVGLVRWTLERIVINYICSGNVTILMLRTQARGLSACGTAGHFG